MKIYTHDVKLVRVPQPKPEGFPEEIGPSDTFGVFQKLLGVDAGSGEKRYYAVYVSGGDIAGTERFDAGVIDAQDVVKGVLLHNAEMVYICHTGATGTGFDKDDVKFTKDLVEAAETYDFFFADHIGEKKDGSFESMFMAFGDWLFKQEMYKKALADRNAVI